MAYEALRNRLEDGLDCRPIHALPDGSVDHYYAVETPTGERIDTQQAFAERLADTDVRSLNLVPQTVRAGGEAVNAAIQIDALEEPVSLYGHLEAPELGPFPFETVSMGEPATVHVLAFQRAELMLSVESGDINTWALSDLFETIEIEPDDWVADAVVLVQNWVGFPAMTDAIEQLATVDLGESTVVFDPGDVTEASAVSLRELCAALSTLGDEVRVVLTGNDAELDRFAAVLDADSEAGCREARIRDAVDVAAVVRHAEDVAVAAAEDVTTVENFEARAVSRRTGAGDRFDGGLAVGLAAGLDWEETLALGNACASYYVDHDATATRADLIEMLTARI